MAAEAAVATAQVLLATVPHLDRTDALLEVLRTLRRQLLSHGHALVLPVQRQELRRSLQLQPPALGLVTVPEPLHPPVLMVRALGAADK